ncbi:MAG: hypothetical protein IAB19_09770 [Proteobacteria bacterium]|uniref:Uncharacterized protein n=1 Tax=Candidatus Avisuccinivibrio stercorigallinarum TaxID=2840704 RepID=A0A9D9DFW7_9GAMM|nr:hypothetical protein [Candidatus Avisuccinivibrio stercorigallinarum]
MTGFIAYDKKHGGVYAKFCISRRDGRKVYKTCVSLGRVLDIEHNIFRNRSRGVYTFDPKTGEYGSPDPSFVPEEQPRGQKRAELWLDFGDAFFLDSFIKSSGFGSCLEAAGSSQDTLQALLLFTLIRGSQADLAEAEIWFEGSYARIMYPQAKLTLQQQYACLDFLTSEGVQHSIAEAYCSKFGDADFKLDKCPLPGCMFLQLMAQVLAKKLELLICKNGEPLSCQLAELRNQKCTVRSTQVRPEKPTAAQAALYQLAGICCPDKLRR